jgi:hypothetical protein
MFCSVAPLGINRKWAHNNVLAVKSSTVEDSAMVLLDRRVKLMCQENKIQRLTITSSFIISLQRHRTGSCEPSELVNKTHHRQHYIWYHISVLHFIDDYTQTIARFGSDYTLLGSIETNLEHVCGCSSLVQSIRSCLRLFFSFPVRLTEVWLGDSGSSARWIGISAAWPRTALCIPSQIQDPCRHINKST